MEIVIAIELIAGAVRRCIHQMFTTESFGFNGVSELLRIRVRE
jgi:hypothetical protein